MKYVSDKYDGPKDALLDVLPGGSFADIVALKGDNEIGDKIKARKGSDKLPCLLAGLS